MGRATTRPIFTPEIPGNAQIGGQLGLRCALLPLIPFLRQCDLLLLRLAVRQHGLRLRASCRIDLKTEQVSFHCTTSGGCPGRVGRPNLGPKQRGTVS